MPVSRIGIEGKEKGRTSPKQDEPPLLAKLRVTQSREKERPNVTIIFAKRETR